MAQSRVYVGRLSYRASERDIEHFFRGYGRIRDVVLKNGFGFVEFEDSRDADDAVYELNGKDLCGERVVLEFSRRGPRGREFGGYGGGGGGRRDFGRRDFGGGPRGGVNSSSTDLKDIMRSAGEVTYADAHKQHRNEGVVCFANHSDLENAIEKLQGKDINGRKIKIVDDSDSKGYSRSRSRSRGRRSRSRSKSRSRSRSRKSSRSRSSRSRSRSRSNTRSRSPRDKKERKRKRSPSRSKSRSKSKSRSRSKSAGSDKASKKGSPDKKSKTESSEVPNENGMVDGPKEESQPMDIENNTDEKNENGAD